jgi:hypothetical protein
MHTGTKRSAAAGKGGLTGVRRRRSLAKLNCLSRRPMYH